MNPPAVRLTSAATPASDTEADWLVVGVPQEPVLDTALADLDLRLGGEIVRLREAGDVTGKALELTPLLSPRGVRAKRILLVGLGASAGYSRAAFNDAAAAALRSVTGKQHARIALLLPGDTGSLDRATATLGAAVGAVQGCYGPGLKKAEPSRFAPTEIAVLGAEPATLRRAQAEANAVTFARELVNRPPSELYPESFAAVARESGPRVECEVWDEARLAAERMGAILGVAAAAARPPRMVVLRYSNGGAMPPLALVGKGVTFDSGGLSLKTTEQMVDMKCDMAGAATVLAAVRAAAELELPVNLLGVLPLVENMPGGRAMKLGDVLHARNGKTIEVLNTDAEGRLILADALAYAVDQRPGYVVDLATLTGSCMIALGTEIAGLMSNDDVWAKRVRDAIVRAGERAWPLPMDADFEDLIRGKVADLKNVGPSRFGGAIVGGKFLEQFVADVPWVHLDIAGPAWADHDGPTRDVGGTGAYVRSLIELAATYGSE
ncbi:MAG TPA: leucyl aminopeptidase [Gemmataceae bacterium]|nr:leucyl aminopeptidase [Gemmataceae bacterium]